MSQLWEQELDEGWHQAFRKEYVSDVQLQRTQRVCWTSIYSYAHKISKDELMAIVRCSGTNCKNDYQDKRYGKGLRVANKTTNGNYKCTVCMALADEGQIDKSFNVREDE